MSGNGFFAMIVGLAVLSALLGGGAKSRRSRRGSRRRSQPVWKDLLFLSIGMTALWAVLVAPVLSSSSGSNVNLDVFSAMLNCGVPIAWIATIGIWAKQRSQERRRFDGIRTINDLLLLPHDEFEHFIAHLFRVKGNQAIVVGGGGDHGIDVVVETQGGQRAIVQCKRWSGKWVDESVVRDLYGAMMHESPDTRGFLVTTSTFSEAARDWAEGKPITLIDGERLAQAIGQLRLSDK